MIDNGITNQTVLETSSEVLYFVIMGIGNVIQMDPEAPEDENNGLPGQTGTILGRAIRDEQP